MMGAINEHLVHLGVRVPNAEFDSNSGSRQEEGKEGKIVGGYFIWLELPSGVKGAEVVRKAKEEENLILGQGEEFAVLGDEGSVDLSGCVRICFAWEDEDKVVEGVRRLGRVVRALLDDGRR